jgi:hypothetical protein
VTVAGARRPTIVLVALLTAACSLTNTGDPNVAAVIGGEEIPVSAVEEQLDAQGGNQALQQDTTGQVALDAQAEIVTGLVRSQIVRTLAEREDVSVSDSQVQQELDQLVEQSGGQEEFERRLSEAGVSEDVLRQQVWEQQALVALQEQVGEEQFEAFLRDEVGRLTIEINPRFGEWDEQAMQVGPLDPFPAVDGQAAGDQAPAADDAASPPPAQ